MKKFKNQLVTSVYKNKNQTDVIAILGYDEIDNTYLLVDTRDKMQEKDANFINNEYKIATDTDIRNTLNKYLKLQLDSDEWCAERYREQEFQNLLKRLG